jgi:HEPN domain-containing protein
MAFEESLYPEDWFNIGDKEIKRARILLSLDDIDGSGFNIQQAIEKYLKGYLLSKGWELRRIHDLETLLNETIIYDPTFNEFMYHCQVITEYYMAERYPFTLDLGLTKEEMEESLAIAEKIIEKIRKLVTY